MDRQVIQEIVNLLDGVTNSEWARIKKHVDMMFSSAAAKVELGSTTQLKKNLEGEFNLRRFGETLD